jgi:hypothetical protein
MLPIPPARRAPRRKRLVTSTAVNMYLDSGKYIRTSRQAEDRAAGHNAGRGVVLAERGRRGQGPAADRLAPVRAGQRLGPGAAAGRCENAYLRAHSFEEYAQWHLGLTEGAADGTKARYASGYGDFRRVHRTGLIACVYRAAEWRHKQVELAAFELLQHLDRTSG